MGTLRIRASARFGFQFADCYWRSILPKIGLTILAVNAISVSVLSTPAYSCSQLPQSNQSVCLKSPASSPGDIYLRDQYGQRLDHNWPDVTPATFVDASSDCRYGLVTNEAGESAWVSSVVIADRSVCGDIEEPQIQSKSQILRLSFPLMRRIFLLIITTT